MPTRKKKKRKPKVDEGLLILNAVKNQNEALRIGLSYECMLFVQFLSS